MTVAVDTSALIAIIGAEPDAAAFVDVFGTSPAALISTATLLEAHCVASRSSGSVNASEFQMLIDRLELTVVPFDLAQLEVARLAYSRYGRGSGHRADLNMGDCFAYALAKTRNLPLLFKGNDFIHTDIEPALRPA
ncbi:MAG: type II toxin-antitoxin system VapC family toxin [Mesorhizobium sp.]|uniref:type II toxin-antitoxin system VapC family toxin n=1 Tax=unclassified Mesorhizobium TaxID=325217 RepID=UPI000FD5F401|nr:MULTISPECIES: type II toxin-antitoxin system VapC family toxin [unclassified Mesorhizobium]RUV93398.1 type II toxin-antitoxin system VapC family toxin [Mesorhizobium sp. M5C.F.Ca.IN.020.14.1.1]RUV32362.1 type II toxin-antitoxin system VapC family toxin [Mesorhizobium sp. M5C.F.Ca.IN.020.32.2.1]RWE09925.1 MAG: type II toxin-antitoxin system VapC family toxin [Mesorhizobium sp.]RWG46900.1 MAG: type II toxin-antitoxin system VapC family toxin [Mesorhizobium sp.]RWH43657.1 MAG: type II toxin-an